MPGRKSKEEVPEKAFQKWCAARGLWCIKLNILGFRGMPDRMVVGPHLIVFFEFKRQGEEPTTQQEERHYALRRWGFQVHTVYTKEHAVQILATAKRFVQAP